jgi:hypothetical protein
MPGSAQKEHKPPAIASVICLQLRSRLEFSRIESSSHHHARELDTIAFNSQDAAREYLVVKVHGASHLDRT